MPATDTATTTSRPLFGRYDVVRFDEHVITRPGNYEAICKLAEGARVDTFYSKGAATFTGEYHIYGKRGAHYVSERVVRTNGTVSRIEFVNVRNPLAAPVALAGNYSLTVEQLERHARDPLGDDDRI